MQWLKGHHVYVSQQTSNDELLAGFNVRSSVKATSIVAAAGLIDPRFKPSEVPKPKKQKAKAQKRVRPNKAFYQSAEWKRVRYDVLAANDGRCELCGVSKHDGAKLNVDHIKSLRDHWDLRLDPKNLQVLCGSCNAGKGNRDTTDWREPSLKVLMGEGMK